MVGQRFLRQRRASVRQFAAAEIAELLEFRRLLAAVTDEHQLERSLPEVAPENNTTLLAESAAEQIFIEAVIVDAFLPVEQLTEAVVEDRFAAEDSNEGEEFAPILAVCELPEDWMQRVPVTGEPDFQTYEYVCETQIAQPITVTVEEGVPVFAEYVAGEWSEKLDFNDSQLVEQADFGGVEDFDWSGFTDVGADSAVAIALDGTSDEKFIEDGSLESVTNLQPVFDDFSFFVAAAQNSSAPVASVRGGEAMILRTLSLSIPGESSPDVTRSAGTAMIPEQRRAESIFVARPGLLTRSADREAEAKLALARNETRSAASGTFVSPLVTPKRSAPAFAVQSGSTFEDGSETAEGSQPLDIFGEDWSIEGRKPARSNQSRANRPDDSAGPETAESAEVWIRQVAREATNQGDSLPAMAQHRAAAVFSSLPPQ
jgi:hypothetical protein